MPKQIIQYQCCECLAIYVNEQGAINCENSHYTLDDFIISKIGKHGYNSFYPDSIHVINQKIDKIALYTFTHDDVKPNHRWTDSLDKIHKKDYYPEWKDEEEDG